MYPSRNSVHFSCIFKRQHDPEIVGLVASEASCVYTCEPEVRVKAAEKGFKFNQIEKQIFRYRNKRQFSAIFNLVALRQAYTLIRYYSAIWYHRVVQSRQLATLALDFGVYL